MRNILRIAHIDTERTWRGGEQQLVSLVKQLDEMGHHNIVIGRSGSELARRLSGSSVRYVSINPLGEWDLLAARRLARTLKESSIDIIHAHTSHGTSLGILAGRRLSVPVVVTRRVDFHLQKNWFSAWKYRQVAFFVGISTAVRDILLEDGIPCEKIAIVPDGVDFSRYDGIVPITRGELGFAEDAFIIGQVAALAPHKDQSTFLDALAILKPRFPRVRGLLVGEGECRKMLEKKARALGLEDTVLFAGFRTNPVSFLAGFDVFCLSSKEEGLGSSLLDAMAMEIPIVATTAGGIPDLIQNGVHGLLVPPLNPVALAESLASLVASSGKDHEMIRRAREKSRQYNISRTGSEMESIYQTVGAASRSS